MSMKSILLICIILLQSLRAASASSAYKYASPSNALFLVSARQLKYPNWYTSGVVSYRVKPVKGLIALRDRFMEKVKLWEKVHGRSMRCTDLIRPYLVEGREDVIRSPRKLAELKVEDIKELPEETLSYWTEITRAGRPWMFVSLFFGGFSGDRAKYDRLFAFQIEIELTRLEMGGGLIDHIQRDNLINWKKLPNYWCISTELDLFPSLVRESEMQIFRLVFKEEEEEWGDDDIRIYHAVGLPSDPPEYEESLLRKMDRFLRREPAPAPPPPPPLPRTSPESTWRYMHEVEGIGFSVVMPLFPSLRSECVPLEAYGLSREVIGDDVYENLIRPFVPPPYELDRGAFEEVAEASSASSSSSSRASSASASSGSAAEEARTGDVSFAAAAEEEENYVDPERVTLLRKRPVTEKKEDTPLRF